MAIGNILVSFPDILGQNLPSQDFYQNVIDLLNSVRGHKIAVAGLDNALESIVLSGPPHLFQTLRQLDTALATTGKAAEAEALENVVTKCLVKKTFGGLGLDQDATGLLSSDYENILFLVDAYLEALISQERSQAITPSTLSTTKSASTKPMNLTQKIFAHHSTSTVPVEGLKVGDTISIAVDWVITSEARLDELGENTIWRTDRFWIAGDHVVDPRVTDRPKVRALVTASEKAKHDYKMTEYQGMNYTIMHTEFVRERAQPGMVAIGADSHTCSAGAVSCLAIGLGAADVIMPLVTGETWFKVPESIFIRFIGKPTFGMTGKDVILYILKELKRNTVAASRVVEFSGPGAKWLSIDARFAICNMCTEFGAITGIFVPDEITRDYISKRRLKTNRSHVVYFQPDDGAEYAGIFDIDLSNVTSTIAIHPSPDNVVAISEKPALEFDGVFIGSCTTTEEEPILAALVLQIGLEEGIPIKPGKRHMVAGSLPIVEKLESLGLLSVYEAAAFTRGVPGCSYCIAMSADQAKPGETWLSSQNRNYRDRMGPGSFANITSAATVASSSFGMRLTDPRPFLEKIDQGLFKRYTKYFEQSSLGPVDYVEPSLGLAKRPLAESKLSKPDSVIKPDSQQGNGMSVPLIVNSKIITLGDFIDTDAMAPSHYLVENLSDEELGTHCLENTHPNFRENVKNGQQVLVAGSSFGCGSSREQAVLALKERRVTVDGHTTFYFQMADMEWKLTINQGLVNAYKKFGRSIWEQLTASDARTEVQSQAFNEIGGLERPIETKLEW
ncbi:hypothetical protein B7463_g10652, partial [Scytalidium lignicola]